MFPENWFAAAFALWGSPVTWLEIVGFVLSLAMVVCNMRVLHWGWPLAIAASVLYGVLFAQYKLYAEAALQVFFIVVSCWGWQQWLRGAAPQSKYPTILRTMNQEFAIKSIAALAILTAIFGIFLQNFTDSDVPWADALPSAMSVVGQVLLAKKFIANWPVWLVVNVLSVALFAYKGLYLTAVLYALFGALSIVGWAHWLRLARA